MNTMKPEAFENVRVTADTASAKAANRVKSATEQNPVTVVGTTYDALDRRLMATFPASDATAQY